MMYNYKADFLTYTKLANQFASVYIYRNSLIVMKTVLIGMVNYTVNIKSCSYNYNIYMHMGIGSIICFCIFYN